MNTEFFDIALLNLISDPYDKDHCFYGHIIAQCNIHIDTKFQGVAGVSFKDNTFHLYINPLIFEQYTQQEQKAILVHESMHIIFNHIGRKAETNSLNWNIAVDAAINQFIPNLPDGCIYPETIGEQRNFHAEYYYKKISLSKNKCLKYLSTLDNHLLWNGTSDFSKTQCDYACQNIINKAIKRNKGHIPKSTINALELLNHPSQIVWQKVLKNLMNNSQKHYEYSYKKVNRRFSKRQDIPGKQSKYMPTVVCIIDVSGSMSNKDISRGLVEIQKICKIIKYQLVVIQVDTEIQDISKTNFKNYSFIRKGIGGTELYSAINYIYNNKIQSDLLIIITDGFFSFKNWIKIPKTPMFFLITSEQKIDLPTKKSYQFLLSNTDEVIQK